MLTTKVEGQILEELTPQIVLQNPCSNRSKREIDYLARMMTGYEFAKTRKFKEKDLRVLAEKMEYQSFTRARDVYRAGSDGDFFYIVVSGHV